MRKCSSAWTALCAAAFAVGLLTAGSVTTAVQATGAILAQDRPVKDEALFLDYGGRPARTIDELLMRSPLVLEATVLATRPADDVQRVRDDEFPHKMDETRSVRTAYRLGQIEWVKTHAMGAPTGTIEVILPGGVRDVEGQLVNYYDPAFPAPKVGERYLFFLTPGIGGWELAYQGPESAFRIEAGRLVPLGRSELSRSLAGRERRTAIDEIRTRGIRAR
jgi:hypothetical protein